MPSLSVEDFRNDGWEKGERRTRKDFLREEWWIEKRVSVDIVP